MMMPDGPVDREKCVASDYRLNKGRFATHVKLYEEKVNDSLF